MAEFDSDIEEIERSFHNMSLDDNDEDLGCLPMPLERDDGKDLACFPMSAEKAGDEDLGCLPMPIQSAVLTSTPKKVKQRQLVPVAGKHDLTPDSKRQNEPPSKIMNMQSGSPLLTSESCELPKPSGVFYKRRRESYVKMLLEHFEEREGAQVKQEAVMKVLQLNNYKNTGHKCCQIGISKLNGH
ncbi:uncharacterized protein LOC114520808 [Dendronephthya gigantea]|uniref:uncharacterized protein LOC114520808 n=1 Tax=Dendronephthya gigantea TaxID=151771 RepID=UPI00106AE1D3|nr:uncharacterized protein LOC114520808 [Dendronephthya gigantea]